MSRSTTPPWLAEILDRLGPLNSIRETADALHVPPATVRGYIRRGLLPAIKYGSHGSRVVIPRESIRDLLLDGLVRCGGAR